MIKKILLFTLIMFPVIGFAQESQKIAYINYVEVITAMPEYKQMEDSLMKSGTDLQNEMKMMSDDYTKRLSEYVAKQDSLSEAIKVRRQQEISDLRERLENFQQQAYQIQQELEQTLLTPIQAKAQKAINEVGAESNFLYILTNNPQVTFYVSPNAVDATPMVKKKLGIK